MSENLQLFRRARLAATATLTLVSMVGMAGLAACGGSSGSSRADDPAAASSSDPSSPAPASSAPSSDLSAIGSPIHAPSSATTSADKPATVFFVGDGAGKPRLFGETAEVPTAAPLDGAVQALMSGPRDPDYRSSYASGAFGDVSYDQSTGFTVVLTDPSLEQQGSLTKEQAKIAVQQLVYTLETVQGVTRTPVTVVADGHPVPLFGIDTSNGVKPMPQLDARGLVNILSPQNDESVSGTLTVRGEASSFEATVPWKLTDQAGKVVKQGSSTAAGWEKLYPWQAKVDLAGLAPGAYTFTASTDDPSDGEGPGPTTDTKTITVK